MSQVKANTPKAARPKATPKAKATAPKPKPTEGELVRLKAEAEAAKAKAKAEAEAKAAKVSAATEALDQLVPDLLAAEAGEAAARDVLTSAQLTFGNVLLKAKRIIIATPELDTTIAKWAAANVSDPDECGPVWGSSRACRALYAAEAAAETSPDVVGATSVNALSQLYRLVGVKGRNGTTAVERVLKAAKPKSGTKPPTAAQVEAAMRKLYPAKAKATSGPAKGSEAAKAGGKAKAAKAKAERNTPTEPTEVPDLAVSPTRLKAAASRIGKYLGNYSAEADRLIAIDALRVAVQSCIDYGATATLAAIPAGETAEAEAEAA